MDTTGNEEGHVEEHLEKEPNGSTGSGHRVQGTGSSADTYSLQDHGEIGGDSHPKPKEEDDAPRTEREREPKNKP